MSDNAKQQVLCKPERITRVTRAGRPHFHYPLVMKRPFRLVSHRVFFLIPSGPEPNQALLWYYETLACGHDLLKPADVFEQLPPPKRRLCVKCAKAALR